MYSEPRIFVETKSHKTEETHVNTCDGGGSEAVTTRAPSPHPAYVETKQIRVDAWIMGRGTTSDARPASLADVMNAHGDALALDALADLPEEWRNTASEKERQRMRLVADMLYALDNGTEADFEAARAALDAMKYDADGNRIAPVALSFRAPAGSPLTLLDVDLDEKELLKSGQNPDCIMDTLWADPHVIAIWPSRRGVGFHGVFVCGAHPCDVEQAKRYISIHWPLADKSAIAPTHWIIALPGYDKGTARPLYASEYERRCHEANEKALSLQREVASRRARETSANEARRIRYFEAYLEGLRSDCTGHVDHASMIRLAARCGCVLRTLDMADHGTVERCARIIHDGTRDDHGRPRETLRHVIDAIQWSIRKGTFTVELGRA